MYKKNK